MINIVHLHPPIPSRKWDYCATVEGYEPGDPIGYGETPEASQAQLQDQLDDIPDRSGPDYREAWEYYMDEAHRKRRERLENGG